MKILFDNLSATCSKTTTQLYSTSFSLGIYFLKAEFHKPIYGIYGFVRLADEIVDSFHDYNKEFMMAKIRQDTVEAIRDKISINPILNSFQHVVHTYNIEWKLVDTFLKSMEMDLMKTEHTPDSYNEYILGSAEVVGLMCLRVFTEGNNKLFEDLKPFAMKLGAAFQKVNFLRDLKADYQDLGRTYFPGVNFNHFSSRDKEIIQQEIEDDFEQALVGIRRLPSGSRRGVYLAYYYYKKLFLRIKETAPENVMNARIRIPDYDKVGLMFRSLVRHQFDLL
ncbi:phytoene/squalene synthase family protein [Dyadobacter sediminis]|uniref:Phytoene/squalene synthase family protein n=1 Tax=Dyadobacter sediminis TaxID=1493691 RepID=A0A5R9KKW0_9BACT|nr:squalene/phytoene synthase family protein [Dyadobacter sediminis]TLU96862.1 phytoene/squalene synthase family protein [Dyadobacter sediminis]GGB85733.1 phytoene synthase [Dyadobacter sediminis]